MFVVLIALMVLMAYSIVTFRNACLMGLHETTCPSLFQQLLLRKRHIDAFYK